MRASLWHTGTFCRTKHNLVGSADAAQRLPGDWTEGPVPDITKCHQGKSRLRVIQRRFLGVQVLTPGDAPLNLYNFGVMPRPPA